MSAPHSASSHRSLLSRSNVVTPTGDNKSERNNRIRDPAEISLDGLKYKEVIQQDGEASEEVIYQVDIENTELLRKERRSELAAKNQCLTRRWQTALTISLFLLALGGGIGK